jgi:chromosome segregation ATPase
MSRGWESKSVENQQALQEPTGHEPAAETVTGQAIEQKAASTVGTTAHRAGVVAMRANMAADAELKRKRQALELQRERILSERTSSSHRRTALEAALLEIEEKLGELGWTVHL